MKIPHASRIAEIKAEGQAKRIKLLNEENARIKEIMQNLSRERFTEDVVADQITKAIEDGYQQTHFMTVKYDHHLEKGGAKTEYVLFPSNIIQLVKDAGYKCTHQYVNEFVVFFTQEAENRYYK